MCGGYAKPAATSVWRRATTTSIRALIAITYEARARVKRRSPYAGSGVRLGQIFVALAPESQSNDTP